MKSLGNFLKLDDWQFHSQKAIKHLVTKDIKSENSRDTKKYINLSSLLTMVCPRYYYMLWDNPNILKETAGSSSMRNVWIIGKALEEHVVEGLVDYYGHKSCLGRWKCSCGHLSHNGFLEEVKKCPKCGTTNTIYSEFDLTSDEYGIVGHPDFVTKYNGKLLVYEFKSTKIEIYHELLSGKYSSETKKMIAKHRLQGISYIKLLRKLGHEVHDRLMLTYLAKDYMLGGSPYHILQCIPTDIEHNTLQDMFERAKVALTYKDNKQLPQRICASREEGQGHQCKLIEHCFRLPNNVEDDKLAET